MGKIRCAFLLICTAVLLFTVEGAETRTRQISALEDNVYDVLFQLCKGEFNVPVKKRSATQRATVVRFWRSKDRYRIRKVNGEEKLFFDGKLVLTKSELKDLIKGEYKHCKGIGSRKLKHRLNKQYQGVSEPSVQKILSNSKLNQKVNARFTNKAILRPIRARAVQVRHQIDLVDMRGNAVNWRGKVYKYILTVQDIFSRYLWLRPLESKRSTQVARELRKLYSETGPPRVLQSDNGGEFKKAVEKLCRTLSVKIIRSSPYHPQTQGKVERSHRSLRKKIAFDLCNFSEGVGVNWAKKLLDYQKILNEEPMEVLGSHSPFEVFYGRTSNAVSNRINGGQCDEESNLNSTSVNAKGTDHGTYELARERIRRKAKRASDIWDVRYIKRKMKGNPPSEYNVGEDVLIRHPFIRSSRVAPEKRCILRGRVIKRNLRLHKYEIEYLSPTTKKATTNWVSVEDITSNTGEKEKKKKHHANLKLADDRRKRKKNVKVQKHHKKKFYIPMTKEDYQSQFLNQGYRVIYDPAGDGNCQFQALAHLLRAIGILRSGNTLREEVVRHLEANPNNHEGIPLELFAGMPWAEYLASMATNSTYGDQITLQAVCNIFQVKLIIISTLGPQGRVVIYPQNSIPIFQFTLGHYAEGAGTHYVCLEHTDPCGTESENDSKVDSSSNRDSNNHMPNSVVEGTSPGKDSNSNDLPNTGCESEGRSQHPSARDINGLPTEVLDKVISFALTGAQLNIIHTYDSLCQLGDRFEQLTTRHIDRLPRVSYIHCHTALGRHHSMRKICKELGQYSGLVLALKEIIGSPKWINAWVELIITGVGTWVYVRNVYWKAKSKKKY